MRNDDRNISFKSKLLTFATSFVITFVILVVFLLTPNNALNLNNHLEHDCTFQSGLEEIPANN